MSMLGACGIAGMGGAKREGQKTHRELSKLAENAAVHPRQSNRTRHADVCGAGETPVLW